MLANALASAARLEHALTCAKHFQNQRENGKVCIYASDMDSDIPDARCVPSLSEASAADVLLSTDTTLQSRRGHGRFAQTAHRKYGYELWSWARLAQRHAEHCEELGGRS